MTAHSEQPDLRSRLAAPFAAKDIEWRIARSGIKDGKPWGMCLAYLTNRAIMDRLDEVVGPARWRNEYTRWGEHGVMCGLSIKIGDPLGPSCEWVTKWDGAEETDIESVKGGLSSAMKRAAVQWGIGRYLYDLEEGWAVFGSGPYTALVKAGKEDRGTYHKWAPPTLPDWALPTEERGKPAAGRQGAKDAPKPAPAVRQPLSEPPKALALPTTWKGNPLTGMDSDTLVGLREFMVRTPKKAPAEDVEWVKHIEAIDLILDGRRGE